MDISDCADTKETYKHNIGHSVHTTRGSSTDLQDTGSVLSRGHESMSTLYTLQRQQQRRLGTSLPRSGHSASNNPPRLAPDPNNNMLQYKTKMVSVTIKY